MDEQHQRRGLRDRLLGDRDHLGWWTLPVFVAVALLGAVGAGTLAAVRYEQQVAALTDETAEARAAAQGAAEDVESAREEALAAIDEQVASVRDAIEVGTPLDDVAAAGVVAVRVELTGVVASGTVTPEPTPTPGPQQPSPSPPSPSPPPSSGPTSRQGVGFVVAVDGGDSFVATSYGLVDDPGGPDGVAASVEVTAAGGVTVRGVVHAWDEAAHVAVLRVPLEGLEPLPWRPAEEELGTGDVVVLAGVTPGLVGVQLPGRLGGIDGDLVVTDLPVDPTLDGSPLLDATGRVVALQSSTADDRGPASALVARTLCRTVIQGCAQLEQAAPTTSPSPTGDGDG